MELQKRKRKRRRRWWHRLITIVATVIHPALGAVAAILVAQFTTAAKGKFPIGTLGDYEAFNPTEQETVQAANILQVYVIPTINKITSQITVLNTSRLSQIVIINKLNDLLLKIAVLQAYVKFTSENTNRSVPYMIGQTIELLLAKMNTLVTIVINKTKLQTNVEVQQIDIIASNYSKIETFNIDWNNKTVHQKYQKLMYVQHSTSETEIIASVDNNQVTEEIKEINNNDTMNDTKKNSFNGLFIGLGLLALYKIFSKKEKITGLNASPYVCKNRVKCKGINKRTGHTKKKYRYNKKGQVIKKHKGLTKDLKLKKGYRRAKDGRIIKAKKSRGLKGTTPLEVTIN